MTNLGNRKLRDAIVVIGEGATEVAYLKSLKDKYRVALRNMTPCVPKHLWIRIECLDLELKY